MPDLGKYGFEVGLAYGVSLAVIIGLLVWVLVRSARVRAALQEVEDRQDRKKAD